MTEIRGIDVSACNGKIDWKTVATYGMGFSILRITEKGNVIDPTFEYNYKGCIENKIPVGVYKYSYAVNLPQIQKEATIVVKTLNKRRLDFPVFLDIEDDCQKDLSPTLMMQMINSFKTIVEKAGYKFGIYCGNYWYKTRLPQGAKKYDCWLAAYPKNDNGTLQERLRPSDGIGWQYSSKATIPGISTKVDRDIFYKNYAKINNSEKEDKPVNKVTIEQAIDALISCARNEVGYLEKRSNSQLDSKTANAGSANYTKYWRDTKPEYQGQPWCADFVSWLMKLVFGLETAKKLLKHENDFPFVYCPTLGARMTKYANPKRGDIVLFYRHGTFAHTGIVTKVQGDKFWSIEGNTSGASGIVPNGGGVCEKSYYNSNLQGTKFCRPDYSIVTHINKVSTSTTPVVSTPKNYLSYGDKGEQVKQLQKNLNTLGYKGSDNQSLSVDGVFGANCLYAVREFQKNNNLKVDGLVGKSTQDTIKKALKTFSDSDKQTSIKYETWVGTCSKNTISVFEKTKGSSLLKDYPKLALGNLVDVIGEAGDRYKIRIAQKYVGYVSMFDIKNPNSKYPSIGKVITNGGTLNLRKIPVSGEVKAKIPNGEKLIIKNIKTETSDSSHWYKVRYKGHEGYVSGRYVKIT